MLERVTRVASMNRQEKKAMADAAEAIRGGGDFSGLTARLPLRDWFAD